MLKHHNKPLSNIHKTIAEAKDNPVKAQTDLSLDRMDKVNIERVKTYTEHIINLQELNEIILQQKAKLYWLNAGDINSTYLYVSFRAKHQACNLTYLLKEDGTPLQSQADIEREVLVFYGGLMGTRATNLTYVDITTMRMGPHVNRDQRTMLNAKVIVQEIHNALQGI